MFIDGEMVALVRRDMLTELAAINSQTVDTILGGGIDIYEIGEPLLFSFALVDRPTGRSLCLILGDERKGMAVVETDTDAGMNWGTKLYERILKSAHLIPTGELKAVLD